MKFKRLLVVILLFSGCYKSSNIKTKPSIFIGNIDTFSKSIYSNAVSVTNIEYLSDINLSSNIITISNNGSVYLSDTNNMDAMSLLFWYSVENMFHTLCPCATNKFLKLSTNNNNVVN